MTELEQLKADLATLHAANNVQGTGRGFNQFVRTEIVRVADKIEELEAQEEPADEWAGPRIFVEEILADSSFSQRIIWLARYAKHLEDQLNNLTIRNFRTVEQQREKLAELTTILNAIPPACGLAENCQPPISKPTEPPTTCQIIDQAIAHADKIIWQTDRDEPDLVDIEYKANLLKDLMEELRQANENLRKWGNLLERLYDEQIYQQQRLARELVERRIEQVKREMQGNG